MITVVAIVSVTIVSVAAVAYAMAISTRAFDLLANSKSDKPEA